VLLSEILIHFLFLPWRLQHIWCLRILMWAHDGVSILKNTWGFPDIQHIQQGNLNHFAAGCRHWLFKGVQVPPWRSMAFLQMRILVY
jgi:hypothetical protein